jgi:hypothetical protein
MKESHFPPAPRLHALSDAGRALGSSLERRDALCLVCNDAGEPLTAEAAPVTSLEAPNDARGQ